MTQPSRSQDAPRIAFMGDPLAAWTGGVDLLRFLLSALSSVSPGTTWTLLIPGKKTARQTLRGWASQMKHGLKRLIGRKTERQAPVSRAYLEKAFASAGLSVDVVDYRNSASGLAKTMRRSQAEILLLCFNSLGRSFPFPWVGYIADLQHKRLPQFFSEHDRSLRDRIITETLADAPAVIVNSRAVIRDIEEFYPGYKTRLFALPYCPPAKLELFADARDPELRAPYKLPPRYFLVSNQFTIHKSHETAFLALRIVRDAGYDIHLACTGNMFDYRWPEHSNRLKELIEKNGLTEHIRLLGFISKEDQLAIMRGSVAVIQPTLFEGGPGGGAVYDAVSTGTPCIVSDIPVNLEIDIGVVSFFTAGSAEDLAAKMIGMLAHPPLRPAKEETFQQLVERQQELGRLLLDISSMVAKGVSA